MEQAYLDQIVRDLLNKDNGDIDVLNGFIDFENDLSGNASQNSKTVQFIKDTLITDKKKLVQLYNTKEISGDTLVQSLKLIQKNDNCSLAVYTPKWLKKDIEKEKKSSLGTIICFSPQQQLGEALAGQSGDNVYLINCEMDISSESCEIITEKVERYGESILSVVIDNSNLELQNSSEQISEALEGLIEQVYTLIKTLSKLKNVKEINIQYMYSTKEDKKKVLLNSISGLFKNYCVENSKVLCKSIDIGDISDINEKASLIKQEFHSMGDYLEVAYCNGFREVNVIERVLPDYTTANIVKQRGCYIIVGGLGRIGQSLASHLVSCGASNIVLVGRRALTNEEEAMLKSFNGRDELVTYKKCNILNASQVSKLLNSLNKQYGIINGIYHTAGIIKDSLAINKQQENVIKVLEPKIKGTINIINAAKKLDVDFVMLFSSLASVTGNMGQSDYGFANAFLDNYAELEAQNGVGTQVYSVNWPLWKDGGMQVDDDRVQLMINATGMAPLLTSTALLVIDTIIENKIPRSIILYGHNNRIEKMLAPLCDKQEGIEETILPLNNEEDDAITEDDYSVQNNCDGELYDIVSKYISKALTEVAGIDVETLSEDCSFDEFGLDSIMIERLTNYFESDSLSLPSTILYEKKTNRDLSNYIIENHRSFVDKKFGKQSNKQNEYQIIRNYLENTFCRVTGIDKNSLSDDTSFTEVGLDSILVEKLHTCFEEDGISLPKTIMYEKNNLSELTNYMIENQINSVKSTTNVKQAQKKAEPIKVKKEELLSKVLTPNGDIAIIGVDLRVSGAKDVREFWNNIINKKVSITEVPKTKWDHDKIYSSNINDTVYGKSYCKYGAFLEDADCFDAMFFNISPKEAEIMDPQERILLESVWRLLEDAGYTRGELKRKYRKHSQPGVGVFIGATNHSYALSAVSEWNKGNYTIPSSWQWAFANRISHVYDFSGPSLPVDTGCSSSMTALHLACKSIINGESSIAVVGGVNLYSHPTSYIGASKLRLLSSNNEYAFLGEDSDGFIPGEGVATILIKPLEKAQEDNDKIYGVIKGTAINHSGQTITFFAPSSELQEELIEKVAGEAKVGLNTIDYIEMGTTGSTIGDPIEFRAITSAFKKNNIQKGSCAIGSVKPYIGHLESASGLIAVIKSLLQFKHNKIAPTLLADKINPEIDIKNSPFFITSEAKDFEKGDTARRVLINSISAGGSYASAIIEEYSADTQHNYTEGPYIINISAKSEISLKQYLIEFSNWLDKNPEASLYDTSMMLMLKRECFSNKVSFVCNSISELKEQIKEYGQGKSIDGVYDNKELKLNNFDKSLYSGKAGKAFITAIYQEKDMKKLAYLWTIGADINWNELYGENSQFKKVDLPCYEFEKERYWITDETENIVSIQDNAVKISSLIDANISTLGNVCFSKLFTGEEFFIKDHLGILPAVAYIEMIYQGIMASSKGHNIIGIKNLVLMRPFVVREETRVLKVRFMLQRETVSAQVFSDVPCEIVYAQCNIVLGKKTGFPDKQLKVADCISSMIGGKHEAEEYYSHLERLNSCFGFRFKGIKAFFFRDKEAFAEAGIVDVLDATRKDFNYHPTLLDAGFQSVVALAYKMGANAETIYMPFVTENIEFFEKETAIKYVHVIAKAGNTQNPSEWRYTVEYYSEACKMLARISNYTILAVNGDVSTKALPENVCSIENKSDDQENIEFVEENSITETIINVCAQTLKLRKKIDPDTSLLEYGFDSITFTELSNAINEKLNIDTNPVLFFERNTVNNIVEHILEKYTHVKEAYKPTCHGSVSSQAYTDYDFTRVFTNVDCNYQVKEYSDKYAIIGMSGAFPGSSDIEEFWDNISQGRDLITDIPSDRWDWREYDGDSEYGAYNIYTHSGGFIENVDCFDAKFFKISPLDAAIMDPQQRLVLEHTWKAMEDAGYSSKDLKGTDTSIFIGISNADYGELLVQRKIPTVLTHSMVTNRVSFVLETTGKSEPCDSACSSSLLAIHRAIETLKNGESKMAFAGGVNLILSPNTYVYECLSKALSPTGKCKTFDEAADGYARGEGVGVILIKRLQDALADGDSIYATICGSAVQHGGKSTGLTVPNAEAQASVIKKAYDNAGISMSTVTYIEAHGTGTKLGDPIEIDGLKKAFAEASSGSKHIVKTNACALSSVKTNIGHLEAASGIASVIKAVKSLQNKKIAPTINFKTLNPYIDLKDSPFYVNRELTEYSPYYNADDGECLPRRAGVSAFGIGGVNAHVVLEEHENQTTELLESKSKDNFIFTISAHNTDRLIVYLKLVLENIRKVRTGVNTEDNVLLQRLCYTFQVGRDRFNCRCAINIASLSELVEMIDKVITEQTDERYILCENIAKHSSWCKEKCEKGSEAELTKHMIGTGQIKDLTQMWCYGIDVDWNQLYSTEKPVKIHAPTYPFKKERYWIPEYYSLSSTEADISQEASGTRQTIAFSAKDAFLRDHIVDGKMILPGAVYSEIIMKAACTAEEKQFNCIQDMFWLGNFEAGSKPIELTVSIDKKDSINTVSITSNKLLAKGTVLNNDAIFKEPDIAALIDSCEKPFSRDYVYKQFEAANMMLGETFQTINAMWCANDYSVVQYVIEDDDKSEEYVLNPRILDAAFQSVVGNISAGFNSGQIRVPFYMEKLTIVNRPMERGFILAMRKKISSKSDSYDIFIMDLYGNINVVIQEYVVQKIINNK